MCVCVCVCVLLLVLGQNTVPVCLEERIAICLGTGRNLNS